VKKITALLAAAVIALAASPVSSSILTPGSRTEDDFLMNVLWNQFKQTPAARRPKIGLVFGGGGARGLAHIGVLKVFEQEGVPIDLVVGTSVGAIVGALYCAGLPISVIEDLAYETGWDKLSNLSRVSVVRLFLLQDLLSTEKLGRLLARLLGNRRFDQLDKRFACVSTDIRTGERIIFKEGDLEPAVRASATIPAAFNPVEYRHRYLVDGGVVDNLPTDIAQLMGADFIIAVQVQINPYLRKPANIMETLAQVIMVQGYETARKREELADVVIRPDVGDVSIFDLGRSKQCIRAGVAETRLDLRELTKKILEKAFDRWQLARKPQ
jgi:NTE family protein